MTHALQNLWITHQRRNQITPSTHYFANWIEECVRPLLKTAFEREKVSVLIDMLRFLEQQRFDFSAGRAFKTRPLAVELISTRMDVTKESVRRWFRQLEALGVVKREYRKNPHHKYKNLFNRISFTGFAAWFKKLVAKAPTTQSPPKKKDMRYIPSEGKKSVEEGSTPPSFPTGTIRYDVFWRDLAEKHLPSGRSRPDMNMIAQKFRENLTSHAVSLDHPSITARWIGFCKRARPV